MRLATALCALAVTAAAQSPLTTTYSGTNGLPGSSAVYFDVTVHVPIAIHQLDVNAFGGAGQGAIELWTTPSTWVGNDQNPAAWTLRGSSAVVAAMPQGTPTVAALSPPAVLAAGNHGVAIVYPGTLGPCYSNGNGGNQTYARAELSLHAGAAGGVFTGALYNPRVWNGSLHYTPTQPGLVATSTANGRGCVAAAATFYEHFATAAALDLSHSGFTLQPANGGYAVGPLLGAFVAPSTSAVVLPLGDDTQTAVTLATPFPHPGGSTSSLVVCSNGFVSVGNGNGTSYEPSPAGLLAMAQTVYACWHDYNPTAPGSGPIQFEQTASMATVTWNGVLGYAGTGPGTTPSTFQLQFEPGSGNVHFVFRAMDVVGGSAFGDSHLVGWSAGSAALDPGSIDLSTTLPAMFEVPGADRRPLTLMLAPPQRPIGGTVVQFATDEIPAGSPFGAILLGLQNPAASLAGIGMPGCFRYTDGAATLLFTAPATSHLLPFQVPNLPGLVIQAQAAVLAPQANLTPLGALSSNGCELLVGSQ